MNLLRAHRHRHGRGGILHLAQPRPAVRRRCLEVELEGVHHGGHVIESLLGHIGRGYERRVETGFLERRTDVSHILDPHHRVVVGEGHTGKLVPASHAHRVRRGQLGQTRSLSPRAGMRDLPVLATAAEHVASKATKRESSGARMEMIEGLLLDLVADDRRGASVREALETTAADPASFAQPFGILLDDAQVRTKRATHAFSAQIL